MNDMNNSNRNKYIYPTVAVSGITFIAAIAGFFILPEKIFVQILDASGSPETSTALFLAVGILTVFIASLMCVFGGNPKKWIAVQVVLAISVIGCIVYNYVVLK